MENKDRLKSAGIDIEDAMKRFMNNEAMYLKYLKRLPDEETYAMLSEAMEAGDVEQAFQAAHRLKGLIGNLSLVKINTVLCDIVEVLRSGEKPSENIWKQFVFIYEEMDSYFWEYCSCCDCCIIYFNRWSKS